MEAKQMTDMDLQKKCLDAGAEYLRMMFPDLEDLEKKAHIQNACAAGYSKGYRDAQAEAKTTAETTKVQT